jgi:hypothetical protein
MISHEPAWFSAYVAPFDALYEIDSLRAPLDGYVAWWFHTTGMDQ